jgi:hypothetical protein
VSGPVHHGLPSALPPGERLLWQGRPDWRRLALGAFHLRAVAIYFGALALWRLASGLREGLGAGPAVANALWVLPLALGALGVLALLAWATARATTYTLTSKRLVLKSGVALSVTINLPWRMVDAAALHRKADGSGDIALALRPGERLAYLMLWPHARPWRLKRPEPMLRALPEAEKVAQLVANALAADAGARRPAIEPASAQAAPEAAHAAAA